jgi:hypothetical protein
MALNGSWDSEMNILLGAINEGVGDEKIIRLKRNTTMHVPAFYLRCTIGDTNYEWKLFKVLKVRGYGSDTSENEIKEFYTLHATTFYLRFGFVHVIYFFGSPNKGGG